MTLESGLASLPVLEAESDSAFGRPLSGEVSETTAFLGAALLVRRDLPLVAFEGLIQRGLRAGVMSASPLAMRSALTKLSTRHRTPARIRDSGSRRNRELMRMSSTARMSS